MPNDRQKFKRLKRIVNELRELEKSTPFEIFVEGGVNRFDGVVVVIPGPAQSLYEGGFYVLRFHFPPEYPFKSPSVGFLNKIYHPNVDWESGSVCLNALNHDWKECYTLCQIVTQLLPFLLRTPNGSDPLNADAGIMCEQQPKQYAKRVREIADKHSERNHISKFIMGTNWRSTNNNGRRSSASSTSATVTTDDNGYDDDIDDDALLDSSDDDDDDNDGADTTMNISSAIATAASSSASSSSSSSSLSASPKHHGRHKLRSLLHEPLSITRDNKAEMDDNDNDSVTNANHNSSSEDDSLPPIDTEFFYNWWTRSSSSASVASSFDQSHQRLNLSARSHNNGAHTPPAIAASLPMPQPLSMSSKSLSHIPRADIEQCSSSMPITPNHRTSLSAGVDVTMGMAMGARAAMNMGMGMSKAVGVRTGMATGMRMGTAKATGMGRRSRKGRKRGTMSLSQIASPKLDDDDDELSSMDEDPILGGTDPQTPFEHLSDAKKQFEAIMSSPRLKSNTNGGSVSPYLSPLQRLQMASTPQPNRRQLVNTIPISSSSPRAFGRHRSYSGVSPTLSSSSPCAHPRRHAAAAVGSSASAALISRHTRRQRMKHSLSMSVRHSPPRKKCKTFNYQSVTPTRMSALQLNGRPLFEAAATHYSNQNFPNRSRNRSRRRRRSQSRSHSDDDDTMDID